MLGLCYLYISKCDSRRLDLMAATLVKMAIVAKNGKNYSYI